MSRCRNCNGSLFSSRIQDSHLILEKLLWESGPASTPNPEEVIPILQKAQREIEDCENQIKAFESRRESLREYADQLQALLSPFRKVPDEILQRIFDDCCDMNHFVVDDTSETRGAIRKIPALALSTVCSRWRRNGLAMPSIWSNISLLWEGEDNVELDFKGIISTLDTFLNRGLQHPMTVIIELTGDLGAQNPVLTLLIRHTHRWRSFTDRTRGYMKAFLDTLALPNYFFLEELDIADVYEGDLDIFSSAPKLKKLTLDMIPSRRSLALSIFNQLSHLEFHCPSVHEILGLSDNGHLVTLKTDEWLSVQEGSDFEEVPPPTPCRTIETLILCYDPEHTSRSILPYLTLPSLKTIHLERDDHEQNAEIEPYIQQEDWYNFDPFMAFLSRSSCTLTTLSIESYALSDLQLVDLLIHLPTLLDLSIDDSYVAPQRSPITGRFIESLQVHANDTVLIVPRLHSLKLNVGASSFDDGSVVDMVRSRWTPCKLLACATRELEPRVDCLREVIVKFRNRAEMKGAYESLEEMEREGMRAVVLWQNEGPKSESEE